MINQDKVSKVQTIAHRHLVSFAYDLKNEFDLDIDPEETVTEYSDMMFDVGRPQDVSSLSDFADYILEE